MKSDDGGWGAWAQQLVNTILETAQDYLGKLNELVETITDGAEGIAGSTNCASVGRACPNGVKSYYYNEVTGQCSVECK